MKNPVIAIVGATGLVGNEMVVLLDELSIPHKELKLFASENSEGEVYKVGGEEVEVEALHDHSFEGVDIALFATSSELSAKYVPLAAKAGALVIDNSSYFRLHDNIPLVVPEVNFDSVNKDTKIIANPNCSTIQLVPILHLIQKAAGLKRVVISTYQSVSGAGKLALDELWGQTLSIFNQQELPMEAFQHQIAFNCIPQIDVFLEDGYTKEEYKIIHESRKILGIPDLKITATAVRVPVLYSHAESVNIETNTEFSPEDFFKLLAEDQGITGYSTLDEYPMQLETAGTNQIHVGRVRKDDSVPYGLNMWIVADNVRKGAALNALQIVEWYLKSFG